MSYYDKRKDCISRLEVHNGWSNRIPLDMTLMEFLRPLVSSLGASGCAAAVVVQQFGSLEYHTCDNKELFGHTEFSYHISITTCRRSYCDWFSLCMELVPGGERWR